MADDKEILKQQFETIRDERATHANTANRIGSAFLSLLSYVTDNLKDSLPFLRNDRDDATDYKLTMGEAEVKGDLKVKGKSTLGEATIDSSGNGHMRSLTVDQFIETPEFRYNLQTVYVGGQWRTPGAGLIEDVEILTSTTGIITLKLEDGQIGTVVEDDLCVGIAHNPAGNNETADYDGRDGNFTRAGCQTSYFRITSILSTDGSNKRFAYALRPTSEKWLKQCHPTLGMSFACYSNPSVESRQQCVYQSLTYMIGLRNMTDWEYSSANIYRVDGCLDGFEINGYKFSGTGSILGNVYMYGRIMEWVNSPLTMTADTGDDNTIGHDEQKVITLKVMKGYEDKTTDEKTVNWRVERETEYEAADAEWNHALDDNTCAIKWTDFPVLTRKALFRFIAEYDGETVSCTKILKKESSGSGFEIAFVEPDLIYDAGRFNMTLTVKATFDDVDVTEYLSDDDVAWSRYSRNSSGAERTDSDETWSTNKKGLSRTFSREDLDVGSEDFPSYIRFTATATLNGMPASASREY